MPRPARTALVLQGGGALGAYELGAARRLYKDEPFAPDIIAGVSIVRLPQSSCAAGPGSEATRCAGGILAKDHRVRIVPSATFAALRIRFLATRISSCRGLTYYALPIWTNIYDTEPLARRCPNWSISRLSRIRRPRRDCWRVQPTSRPARSSISTAVRRAFPWTHHRERQLAAVVSDDGHRRQDLLGRRLIRQYAARRRARQARYL